MRTVWTVRQLAEHLGLAFEGDGEATIRSLSSFGDADGDALGFGIRVRHPRLKDTAVAP